MLHSYFTLTGTLLGRYCGSSIPNSIDTSSNVALVRFVTDGSLSASGFRIRFDSSLEGKFVDSLKKYTHTHVYISWSVQFSYSVVSNSLRPHESQHTRPPSPSPSPRVHLDSRPSSRWCHPAISSSVVPFSSCPQSLPASGSFPMTQLLAWGGRSIGVSALASVLPMNTQGRTDLL